MIITVIELNHLSSSLPLPLPLPLSQATSANNYRHLAMIIFLSLMIGVIIVQSLISIANTYFPSKYQPRKLSACKPVAILITTAMLFLILIVWFLASILLAISTIFADFCIAPEQNIINVTGLHDQYSVYYVRGEKVIDRFIDREW